MGKNTWLVFEPTIDLKMLFDLCIDLFSDISSKYFHEMHLQQIV